MNGDKTKLLTNLGAGVFSTAIACLSTSLGGQILFPVLGGIAANIASSFFEKAEYRKLRKIFAETDPDDLNHDLRSLIVKAIQWSVSNIEILYQAELATESQKEELKMFIKNFLQEIKLLDVALASDEKTIVAAVEKPVSVDETFKTFYIQTDMFPVIDALNPFPAFFESKFIPHLQLCFGELLKQHENRPAYIAYTRQIERNLEDGIDQLKKQNEEILKKLNHPDKEIAKEALKFWTTVQKRVNKLKPNELAGLISQSFDQQLGELNTKVDLLVDMTGAVRKDVAFIKGEVSSTKNITKDLHQKLSENWISKHKVAFFSLVGITVLILGSVYYFLSTQPFAAVISLQPNGSNEVHKEYPALTFPVAISLYLPGETKQMQITTGNELVLNNLPHTYKNKMVRLKVHDPYWEEATDSVKLSGTHVIIPLKPTASLGRITGNVKSRNGAISIQGAAIKIGSDTTIYSDGNGFFNALLPHRMKRKEYMVTVEKEGYQTETQLYYPESSDGQFRLTKN
jgi:hypothetical protein